ncbi:MAG: hypothetical protein AB7S38_10320 [Vulcanimicrobiota bacterium]
MRAIVLLLLLLTGWARADDWSETRDRLWEEWKGVPGAELVPLGMTALETVAHDASRAPLEHLMVKLEANRGLAFEHFVPWHVKDREQLGVFFAKQLEIYYPVEQSTLDEAMLKHLGLVKPDFEIRPFMQELYTEQIAGAYDPDSRQFFMVDVKQSLATKLLSGGADPNEVLIYHELDHALGDQHFDLKKIQLEAVKAHNTDMSLAVSSLLEGEATLAMFDFQLGDDASVDGANLDMSRMADLVTKFPIPLPGMGNYTRAPLYFKRALIFPYYIGMGLVGRVRAMGGWPAVSLMYQDLPLSSEQVIHPEKYLEERDFPIQVKLAGLPAPQGWKVLGHDDTGGEFLVRAFLEQHGVEREVAATGWGGDRYRVWTRGEQSCFLWVTVWDTARDAVEFEQAARQAIGSKWQLTRQKDRVILAHQLPAGSWPSLEKAALAAPAARMQRSVIVRSLW